MITVVTSERFDSDPRCDQVVSSLLTKFDEVEILDIQTLRPSVREVFRCQGGTVVRTTIRNRLKQFSTWTSRGAAIKILEAATLAEPQVFPELAQLLLCKSLNASESFLLNRIALSYGALHSYLSLQQSSPECPMVILAEDFPSAVAALLIERTFDAHIVYDAHEMYVEAINLMNPGVTDTFLELLRSTEVKVWQSVDVLATVSPGIAKIMSEATENRDVVIVPNFASITRAISDPHQVTPDRPRFAFFGGAAPHRNVDVLAANWPTGPGEPTLSLYMPPSSWAQEVKSIACTNPNVTIHQPVAPCDLVTAMCQYDFGVIPYAYPFPYSHASPNKFGEYLAAGLPVLAHTQDFTTSLIHQYQLGLVCDFTSRSKLHAAIREIGDLDYYSVRSRVHAAFINHLNWECFAASFVDNVHQLIESDLDASRVIQPSLIAPNHISSPLKYLADLFVDVMRPMLSHLYRMRLVQMMSRAVPISILRRIA